MQRNEGALVLWGRRKGFGGELFSGNPPLRCSALTKSFQRAAIPCEDIIVFKGNSLELIDAKL